MKPLAILGSTGSVGANTLRVVEAFPGRFRVVGLAAGRNVETLAPQIARHRPALVSVADADARSRLERLVNLDGTRVELGEAGMTAVATHPEAALVVAAAVGAVGLVPTYAALEAGKDVALANKETLVMAGELMLARSRETGAHLLPIDSEHCALHQCLDGRDPASVRRLVLTASGGPFRSRAGETFESITPEQALNHPTWSMGRKITIDSATLMNKGLEIIEAHWLFGLPASAIDVVIHPQSVIHSMVEFVDGSVLAQLGVTDMRLPIQYALAWPERWETSLPGLDFTRPWSLDFEVPDEERFPALALARQALGDGGTQASVLNAANEEAVRAFLEGQLPFPGISRTVAELMAAHRPRPLGSLSDVLEADAWARARARETLRAQRRHSA